MLRSSLRSTSIRLSIRYAALYTVLTALVLIAAFIFAKRELTEWVDEDVRATRVELETIFKSDGLDAVAEEIEQRSAVSYRSSMIFQLTDAEGRLIAGNVNGIPLFRKMGVLAITDFKSEARLDNDAEEFILRDTMLGTSRAVIGKSTHLRNETSETLAEVMVWGLAFLLLAGLGFGMLMGMRTERRITAIRSTLTDFARGDLDKRTPVDKRRDDLERVSESINHALDRLQALVESQHQISNDIAHDLKTPIQRLRQRLERARPADHATAAVIEAAISETDEITQTFEALLRIAQIEGGSRREHFRHVDLLPICQSVASAFEAVAEDQGQTFICNFSDTPVEVLGDRELLTQMTANLVENAVRHCPAGSKIVVSLAVRHGKAILSVTDTGPGIPLEERKKVFRRLYRIEKSRTTDGNGLGLSLAEAIAELHGTRVDLGDNKPGLIVTVQFSVN